MPSKETKNPKSIALKDRQKEDSRSTQRALAIEFIEQMMPSAREAKLEDLSDDQLSKLYKSALRRNSGRKSDSLTAGPMPHFLLD